MARYIDADVLIKKIYPMGIGDGMYTINAKAVKFAIDNAPTADVAPKSEIAREIFGEIKTCLEYEYMSYLKAYDYTLLTRIEELENKYTEDQNNEN